MHTHKSANVWWNKEQFHAYAYSQKRKTFFLVKVHVIAKKWAVCLRFCSDSWRELFILPIPVSDKNYFYGYKLWISGEKSRIKVTLCFSKMIKLKLLFDISPKKEAPPSLKE